MNRKLLITLSLLSLTACATNQYTKEFNFTDQELAHDKTECRAKVGQSGARDPGPFNIRAHYNSLMDECMAGLGWEVEE